MWLARRWSLTMRYKKKIGHYARSLADIDFSRKFFHEFMVEREGFSFNVEVVYERLPDFCSHCQTLRNDINNCCWLYPRKEDMSKEKVVEGKA